MKADLHCHSFYSDGRHPPEFVLERAISRGITHLALTDHDCIDGGLHLHANCGSTAITLVNGVEISAMWKAAEIHVVGLCINFQNNRLNELLIAQQARRRLRINEIASKMERAGITGLEEYIGELPCSAPGRRHVCDFLVANGIYSGPKKAFRQISRGGRFYSSPQWCDLEEAVGAIKAADGLAVLAHPHRYPMSKSKLAGLIAAFRNVGGDGIEVSYSNQDTDIRRRLAEQCVDAGLWASQGSDFHDEDAHWMDLGKIAGLPENCEKNAIWLHPGWHC